MVPCDPSLSNALVFCWIRFNGHDRRGAIFCTLARDHLVICDCYQTKKNDMSIGFFVVGGLIFALYMGLTILNIVNSNNRQSEDNRKK